jgi:hypothetical protein
MQVLHFLIDNTADEIIMSFARIWFGKDHDLKNPGICVLPADASGQAHRHRI